MRAKSGATYATRAELNDTRIAFLGLCAYVIAQAFTVPLVAVGPWPIWPTFADFAFCLLLFGWLLSPRRTGGQLVLKRARLGAVVLVAGCVISYLIQTALMANLSSVRFGDESGFLTGAFELVRLAEFLLVFLVATQIPLTQYRLRVLGRLSVLVLIFACTFIVLTYLKVVDNSVFAGQLPDGAAAGPWQTYRQPFTANGLGTIGYNHAYVGAQVIGLVGLCLLLNPKMPVGWGALLLGFSSVAVLVSGSRAGLLAQVALVLAVLTWRALPYLVLAGALATVFVLSSTVIDPKPPSTNVTPRVSSVVDADESASLAERQKSSFEFYNVQNLSGRNTIWESKIAALNDDPFRWIVGWGFGTVNDHGDASAAHMLPLQFIVELGLIGFGAFAVIIGKFLILVWRFGERTRFIFFVLVALLATSLTQETLYPVAAMGHFIGLFSIIAALTLRIGLEATEIEPVRAESAARARPTFAYSA